MTERELFEAALDCEPGERAAFLDGACAGASALRMRVEALLARQEQAGSFLEAADGLPATEDWRNGGSQATEAASQVLESRYKLLEQIGEGGMGSVWLALQIEPVRRRVAVKLIKAGMDSRMVLSRFEAERQALALMDHPNIAKVLDGGSTEQGRPFFVMEYVKGVPITQYCDDAHLSVAERLELFIPVCQAVQHAHQKGVIHRDLKPTNLLICLYDDKPVPKVIDFGLAKATHQPLTEHTLYTAHGLVLGTPLYMSPEQVAVNNLDVDTRTDIYSLGVVLYELLTGTTPLVKEELKRASWPEVLRLIKDTEPPKPSTRLAERASSAERAARKSGKVLPTRSSPLAARRFQELDWIVMKALDKDRGRRYETANGLARDLQRYLHDEPVEAGPPSAWYRLRKLARRNRPVLTTAAIVSLALVVGTAVSVWQAIRATEAMEATGQELQRTKVAEEKATRELFDSLVAQARANRLSRRISQRFGTIEILGKAKAIAHELNLPAARFLELRNEAIAAMALPDLVAKEWADAPGTSVEFDPKLQRYARDGANGTIYVRHAGQGAEICRLPAPGPGENRLAFSPDGRLLAVMNPDRARVQVWRLRAKKTSDDSETSEIRSAVAPDKVLDKSWRPWNCCFSPDSRQIVFQQPDLSLDVFDLGTETSVRRLAVNGIVQGLAFHPKGKQLAFVSEGFAQVRDLLTDKVLWKKPLTGSLPWLEWHPDGNTLAMGASMPDGGDVISLWDVVSDKQAGKLEGMQGAGLRFTFNHAGTLLASAGWGGVLRLWDPLTSRQLFSTFASGQITPRFSPDDRCLAASEHGSNLCIWEVPAHDEYQTLTANLVTGDRRYFCSATSADGQLLAAGAYGGASLWDLRSGKNLAFIEGSPGLNCILFEPSGALLAMGQTGLFRRSIGRDSATGIFQIGAPEKLPIPGVANMIAQSRDGRVLASPQFDEGAVVWHSDQPDRLIKLGPHVDARGVAVSPDGKWVATAGFGIPGGVKVWDARTGKLEKDLPIGVDCWVSFSPDGKRLLANFDSIHRPQIRSWEVGTWSESLFEEPVYGRVPAFSPDGKLLVVETGAGIARLLDPKTGREFARLENPSQDRAVHFSFSPDSAKLVAAAGDGHCLHVWDLRALRKKLAEMGLDWD